MIQETENSLNQPFKTEKRHSEIFKQKVASRRQRELELRCLGYKIKQIQKQMGEEGSGWWDEDTIRADLKTVTAEEWRDELIRQQNADIALEDDRKVKLEYRDRMIERLTPRKSPDVSVQIANQVQVEKNVTVNQLLLRYQQFRRGRDGERTVCSNSSGQQVDQAGADR